jgi:hypothetical protein
LGREQERESRIRERDFRPGSLFAICQGAT